MYGLPRAVIIVQILLKERLTKHSYHQGEKNPRFWRHVTRPISFTLIVDNVGVKLVGKEHVDRLIAILEEFYVVDKDWEGKKYCSIMLDWDYVKRQVHISMLGYYKETLTQF